jgi:hypothetical protein
MIIIFDNKNFAHFHSTEVARVKKNLKSTTGLLPLKAFARKASPREGEGGGVETVSGSSGLSKGR